MKIIPAIENAVLSLMISGWLNHESGSVEIRVEARLESHKVKSVMQPYMQDVSLKFSVGPEDKLTKAVKRMLFYNTNRILVVQNDRPVGIIRLEDALKKLGL